MRREKENEQLDDAAVVPPGDEMSAPGSSVYAAWFGAYQECRPATRRSHIY